MKARFKGRVQGVGFRWTVLEHAESHQMKGTVKNLKDGSVEVTAQGTKENLKLFIKAIQKEPNGAKITGVDCEYHSPLSYYKEFKIIT